MSKEKNFFYRIYSTIRNWYKVRAVRKVFLVLLFVALIALIIAQFERSGVSGNIAVTFAALCVLTSAIDTFLNGRQFKSNVAELEYKHFVRVSEIYGDNPPPEVPRTPFSPEDLKQIKSRKNTNRIILGIKIVFVIILVALLFTSGVQ